MKFTCTIDMDNAAFDPDPESELKRILEGIARVVGCSGLYHESGPILDVNGNTVGHWHIDSEVAAA